MTKPADPSSAPDATPAAVPPASPVLRGLRWLWWSMGLGLGAAVLVLAVWIAVVRMVGQPVDVPASIQARVADAVAAQVPGIAIEFDDMQLVVNAGWQPRLRLRGVQIAALTVQETSPAPTTEQSAAQVVGAEASPAEGLPLIGFGEIEGSVDLRALLQGQAVPKEVEITGVFLSVRRGPEGRITLSSGAELGAADAPAVTVPDLINGVDRLLQRPQLAALTQVEVYGVTLRYEDLRAERAWTADGGRIRLTRDGDALALSGDLALLGGDAGVATIAANYTSQIGSPVAEFGARLEDVRATDIATQSPAFAWLTALRAPITGALRSGIDADGIFAPISASLQIGTGVVQPTAETRPIPFQSMRSYFNYDPASGVMRFDDLSVESQWITTRIEGQAIVGGVKAQGSARDFNTLVGQFSATDVAFNLAGLYREAVVLENADMDFRLQLDPFDLTLGGLRVTDQGQALRAQGSLQARPDGWGLALDGQVDQITPVRLLALWPQDLAPRTRGWLLENLRGGMISGAELSLRAAPDARPVQAFSFDFADTEVQFLPEMPPLQSAVGHASLMDDRFVISLDEGSVEPPQGGALDLAGSAFILPDVTVKEGAPAVLRLEAEGTITAALSLADQPPLQVVTRAGRAPDVAQGRAQLSGQLALPLRKRAGQTGGVQDEVTFNLTGRLQDVISDSLVPGRELRAPALGLRANNSGVRLSGGGTLDGVPFEAAWDQPLGGAEPQASTLRGAVDITPAGLRRFGLDLPENVMSGAAQAEVVLTLPPGATAAVPNLTLRSDLAGLELELAPLGWRKPPDEPGTFALDVALGPRPEITAFAVETAGLEAAGNVALAEEGALERARFDTLRVGRWLDAPVDIVGQGAGAPARIVLRGGVLDLRRAPFQRGGLSGGAGNGAEAAFGPLEGRLSRVQLNNRLALTDVAGNFDVRQGLDGTFTARLNGAVDLRGRVMPQAGRSALRIQSADAGRLFAEVGLLRQARGGDLDLALVPGAAAGTYDGSLRVTNTRIKDAPVFADLLSAISIVGLLEQLSGDGILFAEVDGAFEVTPDAVIVRRASATGPSIGISMDGTYDLDQTTLAMQGVISPVYLLNGLGSIFTRKGEGLIGFNYRLDGPAAAPLVQVNPLSALTPGLFREIFRRPVP